MNIKISGITTMQQLLELDSLDIDFVGLVFDKSSPQFAGKNLLSEQIKSIDFDIKKVGIFVNSTLDDIAETIEGYNLDLVQLNGNESPDFCSRLSEDVTVIKSLYIDNYSEENFKEILADYDEVCDYYSFDYSENHHFSSGDFSRWDFLRQENIQKPFFLGGNTIKPSDAKFLNKFVHPDYFGVTLDRHFEKMPGIKDMALVLTFVQAIRQVNN